MTEPASATAPPPGESGKNRRHVGLALLVLIVAPFFLRLWPIDHGAPRPGYVPDTHIVRNALNMAKDKDPVPPAGTYSSYPYLLPYVLLPAYAAEYVRGRVAGDWSGSGEFGARLQESPWRAHLIARVICASISALAAVFLFFAARAAGLGLGAWVAGWLGATCLLHVQMSTHERPWAPLTAMMAAAAWAGAVHARTGRTKPLLLCGLAAAASFSMNPAGGVALLIAGVAWAVAVRRPEDHELGARTELTRRFGRGFGTVALFAGVALVIGYPFYLRYGAIPAESVAANELVTEDQIQFAFGGTQMIVAFSMDTLKGLTRTFIGYDPVIFFLGLLGLVGALRRRALLPATVFVLAWGGWFMTNQNEQIRYILPMAVMMTLPAGVFAETLARSRGGRIALAVMLAFPLVQALRLGYVMNQRDTRAVAEEMLGKLPGGALVAVDVYGPVPPQTVEAIKITKRLRERTGAELYGREAHRLMMLEADQPQPKGHPVLRLEDAFEYALHTGETWIRDLGEDVEREGALDLGSTTASALRAMGATHLLLTDRTPENGSLPPLIDPTVPTEATAGPDEMPRKLAPIDLPAEPLWTVHPAWSTPSVPEEAAPVPDAHLPTTLKFPLRDLWRVRRPGPKLELYELPG